MQDQCQHQGGDLTLSETCGHVLKVILGFGGLFLRAIWAGHGWHGMLQHHLQSKAVKNAVIPARHICLGVA